VPKAKLRVFLGSNVVFLELYSSKGAPGGILRHFILRKLELVMPLMSQSAAELVPNK
jgi:hypothetical protein